MGKLTENIALFNKLEFEAFEALEKWEQPWAIKKVCSRWTRPLKFPLDRNQILSRCEKRDTSIGKSLF